MSPRRSPKAPKAKQPALRGTAVSRSAFVDLSNRVRPEVEQTLRATWDRKVKALAKYGPDVSAMAEAARSLTLRGGKRYRAILLSAAYTGVAPRAPFDVAIQAGAALELLQTYLLIQDDWMDGDESRRSGPTAHVALTRALGNAHTGAASAILASDLTWGMAIDMLVGLKVPAPRRLALLELVASVHEDVVVGQQIDVAGHAADVEVMHSLKTTSYTVLGPLLFGATLAGASDEVQKALSRFARPLGLAFQLRDDLLGTFGTPEQTGRPPGGDLRAGKRTALIVEAEGRLDGKGRQALSRVLGKADATPAALRAAADALEECGARAAVTGRLWSLCDRAESMAQALPLSRTARAALVGAASVLRPLPPQRKAERQGGDAVGPRPLARKFPRKAKGKPRGPGKSGS